MKIWCHRLVSRLLTRFRRRSVEAEMAEEMTAHLEELTRANLAAGMNPDEARLAARKRFGGVTVLQEHCRDEHGFRGLDGFTKDALFVLRSLNKARGFTFLVLITLILGIGTACFAFNLTSGVLFFAQPYPEPEQLVLIGARAGQGTATPHQRGVQFQAFQDQVTVFSEYAGVSRDLCNIMIGGEPVMAAVLNTSVDCFRTLGIRPAIGRAFSPDEHRQGAGNVIVISDAFWRRHFNADKNVLNRRVLIGQEVCTIVGVLAEGQRFPAYFDGDVYRPLVLDVDVARDPLRPGIFVIGRLRDGVSVERAEGALSAVQLPAMPMWASSYFEGASPVLLPITQASRPEILWVIVGAALFLYFIACLNAVNLMFVRLLGRHREFSIRRALGASRLQISRLVAIESIGLALIAGVIVTPVVRWVFPPCFELLMGQELSRSASYWNGQSIAVIAGLAVLAGLAGLLVPLVRWWTASASPQVGKGAASRLEGRRLKHVGNALVVFQAAMAVVLLAGTGLMTRTFVHLHRVDLGFESEKLVHVGISFPQGLEPRPTDRLQYFERMRSRLADMPGVSSVSYGSDSLLAGVRVGALQVELGDGTHAPVETGFASSDYQRTAGLTLLRGRWLAPGAETREVVINQALAQMRFGHEDPVGQFVKFRSWDDPFLVVGVVQDVRGSVRTLPGMHVYFSAALSPPSISSLLVRLEEAPGSEFAGSVRRTLHEFYANMVAGTVVSLDDRIEVSLFWERLTFNMLRGMTVVAVGLAAIGLFAQVAHTVEARGNEFGVRIALGANATQLRHLVLGNGLVTAAIGVVLGTAVALGLTRFMESLLFETKSYDPAVYAVTAATLLAAAGIASWLPARRAAKIDPVIALRAE